jgi:hypothetical protein
VLFPTVLPVPCTHPQFIWSLHLPLLILLLITLSILPWTFRNIRHVDSRDIDKPYIAYIDIQTYFITGNSITFRKAFISS